MTVCPACTDFCQPMIAKGYGTHPDKPLIAHPECAGWQTCNCACQAGTRRLERQKAHSRPRAAEVPVALPEPMFDL